MPTITYLLSDGRRVDLDARVGQSLMALAASNRLDGIAAVCGGACACATCHVYIDTEFAATLPAPSAMELEMLEFTVATRDASSRLACQLRVADGHDGLVVRLPSRQT